jgi:hypothetical protein
MSLRYIVAAACLYVAFYGVPEFTLPSLPTPTPTRPAVDEPTKDLREAVAGVAEICERMQPFDRMVWMATWQHAADVVAGEDKDVGSDHRKHDGPAAVYRLAFSTLPGTGWRMRAGKYAGLQEAVEQAFTDTIGNEVRPWTDDLADDVVELFDALAWAGAKGE